jgi:hypothetical protein
MLKNSGTNIDFLGKTVGHNNNVAKKYHHPLGINCPRATLKKDNISLIMGEKGKQTPPQNMHSLTHISPGPSIIPVE